MESQTVAKAVRVAEDGFVHLGDLTPSERVKASVRPLPEMAHYS